MLIIIEGMKIRIQEVLTRELLPNQRLIDIDCIHFKWIKANTNQVLFKVLPVFQI